MDSSKTLYQIVLSKLRFSGLMALLLVSGLVALVFYREAQLLSVQEKTVPALSQAQQSLALQIGSLQVLHNILQSREIGELAQHQSTYGERLFEFDQQNILSPLLIKKFQSENNQFTSDLARLALEAEKNDQLKRSSIIQLRLLVDEFSTLISEVRNEKNELYLQITQDNVNDRVTASRAKAYAVISEQLSFYEMTYQQIREVSAGFEQLDLQFSLEKFNFITNQLKDTLSQWQDRFDNVANFSGADQRVIVLLQQLNELMYEQQRTVAKWRGQLRIVQGFLSLITQHQQHFATRLSATELPKLTPVALMPPIVAELIATYIPTSRNVYYDLVVLLGFIGIAIVWWPLLRVKRQIAMFSQALSHSLASGNAEQTDEQSGKDSPIREITVVKQAIASVSELPESKNSTDVTSQSLLLREDMLYEELQTAFWSIDAQGKIQGEYACKLCAEHASQQIASWRVLFDKPSIHKLLTAAKLAKATRVVQHCAVVTIAQKHAQVSVHFDDMRWHGSIVLTELLFEKEQALGKLERSLTAERAAKHQLAMESAGQLSRMIMQTMLQSQNVSMGDNVSSLPVYRQLTRILDWCRQIQISNALQSTDHALQLSDVEIHRELDAIAFNVGAEANLQRNIVFLQVAPNVLQHAKLNIRLFHRSMKGIARLLLADVFNSQLVIKIDVIEQDEGKQIVSIHFDVITDKPNQELPEPIKHLLEFSFVGNDYAPQTVRYLHLLLKANHCEQLNALITDNGINLTFQMPLAFASGDKVDKTIEPHAVNFSSKNMLIVSQCSHIINSASAALTSAQTHFEVLHDVNYFSQQLSVKHLNHHQVSVVLLGPELLKDNIDGIKQHLLSLPSKLRPQLFVMQYPFNQVLHRVGFYQFSSTPFDQTVLLAQLSELFESGAASNEILPAERFGHSRFNNTQVEVLLAVSNPSQHQTMYRLLHWMGLQVQFVCQPSNMLKHWQSGRYLILITEFEQSPFVEMDVGNKVSRAVFTLTEQLFDQGAHGGNWQVDVLPAIDELDALISTFSPWLNEVAFGEGNAKARSAKLLDNSLTPVKTVENESIVDEMLPINDTGDGQASSPLPLAFNLQAFASNQGGAEIAGLMIDEYILQLSQNCQQFEEALAQERLDDMRLITNDSLSIAKIVVAPELIETNQNILKAMADGDYALVKALSKKLTVLVTQFAQSADAI
ncbi:hypothetical protein [Thalassotalea fusca]